LVRLAHRRNASPGADPVWGFDANVGSTSQGKRATETPGGEPLSRLRIAPPVQLELVPGSTSPARPQVWGSMSEAAQVRVVVLLARLIAKGVVEITADTVEEVS